VGAGEAAVIAAYPRAEVQPQKYEPEPAHYIVEHNGAIDRGLRFETDATATVTAIQAGTGEAINLVESCG
jgi:hypothetical protein